MSDFLFFQDKSKSDHSVNLKLPERLKRLNSINQSYQLLSSGRPSTNFHIRNDNIEFYLLGNFTFYKGFNLNFDALIQNNKLNHAELNRVFRKINGIYCCIIINNQLNQLHLCTDYLGFYPIYIYQDRQRCVFSSEIKYFKYFSEIECKLNELAIDSYLNNGHLMLDQSWFQHIKRARPASMYTLNLSDHQLHQEYYWTWAAVTKFEKPEPENIEEYTRLFKCAIEELDIPNDSQTGLSLSGGLDSRWIGQIASQKFNIEAFTFSSKENFESGLAKQVAACLQIKHQNPILEKEHWLINRLQAFWKADGMLHLGHLHEGQLPQFIHSHYAHCFHGFYGGGIYASNHECNKRITHDLASQHFKFADSNTKTEESFYDTPCIDPYIVDQKIRYQSAYSIYLLSSHCKMVLPFYNMDWLEFNYRMDDRLQLHSKFYLEALNKTLNAGLLKIPWQRTGISPKHIALNVLSIKFRIPSILELINQRLHLSRHFINYHYYDNEINDWIREFRNDIFNLQLNYPLKTREQKLRMLSLVLWMKMISENSPDVI